jgi:hypothetical protein
MPSETAANPATALEAAGAAPVRKRVARQSVAAKERSPVDAPAEQAAAGVVAAADFLLAPEAFVEHCLSAHDPDGRLFTKAERGVLIEAILAGRPRLEVLDAIADRADPSARKLTRPHLGDLLRDWDDRLVPDLLERYAPNDEEAFVRQAYSQLLARPPDSTELIKARSDLKSGRTTRRGLMETLAARSTAARHSTGLALKADSGPNSGGAPTFILVRPAGPESWTLEPDVWLQPAPIRDGALQVSEGWVLFGPKRSFPSGPWRLDIDIEQEETTELALSVTSNGGLDQLLAIELIGPARLKARFTIESWHRLVEVRLYRPAQPAAHNWLKVRDLTLACCE